MQREHSVCHQQQPTTAKPGAVQPCTTQNVSAILGRGTDSIVTLKSLSLYQACTRPPVNAACLADRSHVEMAHEQRIGVEAKIAYVKRKEDRQQALIAGAGALS